MNYSLHPDALGAGRRRYLMKHFPYSLVYTVSSEEIRILAVAHHSRRPGYWASRA